MGKRRHSSTKLLDLPLVIHYTLPEQRKDLPRRSKARNLAWRHLARNFLRDCEQYNVKNSFTQSCQGRQENFALLAPWRETS